MNDAAMAIGVALVVYNLYANANAPTTGAGTEDDPFRLQTHSPMLALIGFALILVGGKRG